MKSLIVAAWMSPPTMFDAYLISVKVDGNFLEPAIAIKEGWQLILHNHEGRLTATLQEVTPQLL